MYRGDNKMLDILKKGRDEFGVVALKAEFEAEGTRKDEFSRLLELANKAGLKVALKIGGCEAVSDLLTSRVCGVDYIIAPMVETPYALSKFIEAKTKVYGENPAQTEFLFNLETQTTLDNLDEMVAIAKGNVDGIVFGRVDFTLSKGLGRGVINDEEITRSVLQVAKACRDADLELVTGGGVAIESIPALREFRSVRLDRFETRKVIFDGAAVEKDNIEAGIENAVAFELAWLKAKREYYLSAANEDLTRIEMIESRTKKS
ncbi:aldolase/citrate lyase family protein [Sphingorhabdus arenilitoris]|uniref:Aldolase/citrate lyase family protein n=1 Tax=Sphingorhabdus arenilitoris TaxID=1490041 RepID=A0ABV8RE08_9SPHN